MITSLKKSLNKTTGKIPPSLPSKMPEKHLHTFLTSEQLPKSQVSLSKCPNQSLKSQTILPFVSRPFLSPSQFLSSHK